MKLPSKPRPDFPLSPKPNGQWGKKVNQKVYYFGSWKDDPKGEAALKDWLARKDAIHAGLDKLRVASVTTDWTVGRLVDSYLSQRETDAAAGELSPWTLADYRDELARFKATVGEQAPVANLRPEHFTKYAKLLVSERKLGRHARKRVIAYVKAMLNWGAGNGYYPAPTYGTEFVAPDTSPDAMRQAKARAGVIDTSTRIVTGEEIDKLLGVCQPQYKAIILLGVNCGIGPADLGRLRWSHVDMETGELDMARGKTGSARKGYLWKRTREALRRVATLRHNAAAIKKDGANALVFIAKSGRPLYREGDKYGKQAISRAMGKIVEKAGIDGVTHYRLRHTFKTLGKRAKDRDALNLMMGHREGTTGEIYDHEEIAFGRIKKVAVRVKRGLWPTPAKRPVVVPLLRIAG